MDFMFLSEMYFFELVLEHCLTDDYAYYIGLEQTRSGFTVFAMATVPRCTAHRNAI
jgi:hypothetical protein